MNSKMGENIQREWDEEPLARELWEALQARKKDRCEGAAMLTNLAGRGSALAMMYLGHACAADDDRDQAARGEEWLIRSAEAGSIEGRFQLARHYERQGAWEKARKELEILAAKSYSPAMYFLGRLFYWGDLKNRDASKAVAYLKLAIDAGDLPSIPMLAQISREEKSGMRDRITAHWVLLKSIPTLLRCVWSYPNSDRLRAWGGHFSGRSDEHSPGPNDRLWGDSGSIDANRDRIVKPPQRCPRERRSNRRLARPRA
jgi:TPR repeat protein